MDPKKRWAATIFYLSEKGEVPVRHEFEELSELDGLVEHGPSWDAISRIEIELLRPGHRRMTIEEADRL